MRNYTAVVHNRDLAEAAGVLGVRFLTGALASWATFDDSGVAGVAPGAKRLSTCVSVVVHLYVAHAHDRRDGPCRQAGLGELAHNLASQVDTKACELSSEPIGQVVACDGFTCTGGGASLATLVRTARGAAK